MEEVKKIITIQTQGAAKSVGDLRKEISQLRDAMVSLDSTSKEFNDLARQVAQREQQLQKVMTASKNVTTPYERSLKALTASYANQRQELRALRTALENLSPGTQEYRVAFERCAELTHELQERQELLRRSSSDLGVQLGNMRDIGTGLAAGWSSVNALMTLTGNNSEDLQKAMVKLQAGIALVQGLKGLEGLKNAVKGYINGASQWFDDTVKLNKEQKSLQVSTKGVTDAVNQSSSAELAGAGAANTLAAGERAATTATVTLTAALKALLVSLGIGVAIAAVTAGINALVKAMGNFANKQKQAYENAGVVAENWLETENEARDQIVRNHEAIIESLERQGATQERIGEENKRYYQEMYNWYTKATTLATDFGAVAMDAKTKWEKRNEDLNKWIFQGFDGTSIQLHANPEKSVTSKLFGFSADDFDTIRKMETAIQNFKNVSTETWKNWEQDVKNSYNNIKQHGIKTYQDLLNAQTIYQDMSIEGGNDLTEKLKEADDKAAKEKYDNVVRNAVEGLKTQSQKLKEAEDRDLDIVKDSEEDKALVRKYYAKQRAELYKARMEEIKALITRIKNADKTEIQLLDEKYEKEKKMLAGNQEALLLLEKEYRKKRAEAQFKHDKEVYDKEANAHAKGTATRKEGEYKLEATEKLLSAFGLPSEKAVQDRLDYIHTMQHSFLEIQAKWWEDASKNTGYTEEQRLEAYGEYIRSMNELTKEQTDYYIESAKNRMAALNREIENEKKQIQEKQTWQELNFNDNRLKRSGSSNAGQGLWQAFWGGDNPSYKQLQDEMDAQYAILKAGLDAQIALYKKAAYDKNLTDEERAAAKQKWLETEAELDVATAQHTQAVAENYKSMWETTLDAGLSVMDSFADILGSVADTMEAQVQRQLELGQITEEQAEEQRKKIKAIQIAQTVVSTISGAIGAFTQASATIPPPAGQIVGGAAAAAVIAAGIASIAQMRATNKNTNSISNSLPIASPSMAGFEKDYEANMTGNSEVSALRNAIEGADIRAYVVESDITSAQSRSRRRSSESTF